MYLFVIFFFSDCRETESCDKVHRTPVDSNARLQNWNILLKNIKSFYNVIDVILLL